ncbi:MULTISPECIES: UDP-glucose dehydrogenase family protein [unclassified Paenibacillus]|uniref:UDP-glucose dehydrogenase family protein n=1 Tax=unclassified Paenibacillus TaxID=185978 RepID=UPI003645BBA5
MKNVVCIGCGYVGSVTSVAFAALGYHTVVIDVDSNKVEMINAGKSSLYEPGLESLIQQVAGRTLFAVSTYEPIKEADIVFICVGTPSLADGTADLTYIKTAAKQIGMALNPGKFTVIVNKSTVPVGTADLVTSILEEESGLQAEQDFAVVSNPEFLREGFALEDVVTPDRIVIGTSNERARKQMRLLYEPLIQLNSADQVVYFETDAKSAELIKYASNAFLAVKISYINEVAKLCEALNAHVPDVAKGMGLDSRIGSKFLQVSSGWSGSCFPKDTAELLATSFKYGSELSIVSAAITANLNMHLYCVDKIVRQLGDLRGKTIAILGLTFKPDTDDARATQATVIIKKLIELGAAIHVHDPMGMPMFSALNGDLPITYCNNGEEAAQGVDGLVLLTHWECYIKLDWPKIFLSMRHPYILDTRNFLDKKTLQELGFQYDGIGLGKLS